MPVQYEIEMCLPFFIPLYSSVINLIIAFSIISLIIWKRVISTGCLSCREEHENSNKVPKKLARNYFHPPYINQECNPNPLADVLGSALFSHLLWVGISARGRTCSRALEEWTQCAVSSIAGQLMCGVWPLRPKMLFHVLLDLLPLHRVSFQGHMLHLTSFKIH